MKMKIVSVLCVLMLVGCSSTKVEPKQDIPYLSFDKGLIVDSQKVLIDSSYKTLLVNEVNNEEKGDVLLYKTTVFFKDKNYVLFLGKEAKTGNSIEFILKDDKLTNIQVH